MLIWDINNFNHENENGVQNNLLCINIKTKFWQNLIDSNSKSGLGFLIKTSPVLTLDDESFKTTKTFIAVYLIVA